MKHPRGRAARRFARETWRDRRREQARNWWSRPSLWDLARGLYNRVDRAKANGVWLKGGKQCYGHGNRCSCHYVKFDPKCIRKRRDARNQAESTADCRRLDRSACW